jgi:eukaryotic-like serine/threonine-protein kinase
MWLRSERWEEASTFQLSAESVTSNHRHSPASLAGRNVDGCFPCGWRAAGCKRELIVTSETTTTAPHRTGELIGGRYELCDVIASGGQGHVYRAKDVLAGDWVAVKVLRAEFAQDVAWRERMYREARALCTLSGTSAVRVFDQKWASDGALCIVMELLDGMHLEDVLHVREDRGLVMSPRDLSPILAPVVDTLEMAHRNAIIHRDLKPANIFVQIDGSVRLLDFGFAKFERLLAMTKFGQVAGSPSYLAPECWGGDSSILDRRVDVYGLASVIFRALTGRPPFEGDIVTLLRQVTTAPRPRLGAFRPDLPSALDDWAETALAIAPEQRFDSVGALWNAFRLASGIAQR